MSIDPNAFLELVRQGLETEVFAQLEKKPDLINFANYQSQNALYFCIMGEHNSLLDRLIEAGASVSHRVAEDRGLLAIALAKGNKRAVLRLLLSKCGNLGAREATTDPSMVLFYDKLVAETAAFGAMAPLEVEKARKLFGELDSEKAGFLTFERCVEFNLFVQKQKSRAQAERDAQEFMDSVSIVTSGRVHLEEFLFACSKLKVEDKKVFEQFFSDYAKKVEKDGPMAFGMRNSQQEGETATPLPLQPAPAN